MRKSTNTCRNNDVQPQRQESKKPTRAGQRNSSKKKTKKEDEKKKSRKQADCANCDCRQYDQQSGVR